MADADYAMITAYGDENSDDDHDEDWGDKREEWSWAKRTNLRPVCST